MKAPQVCERHVVCGHRNLCTVSGDPFVNKWGPMKRFACSFLCMLVFRNLNLVEQDVFQWT